MKDRLSAALRRLLGTQGLNERLASIQVEVDALRSKLATPNDSEQSAVSLQDDISALRAKMEELGKYRFLPGTPSSRFALPLDAAPSRHLRPRWGHIRPPIAPLLEWMSGRAAEYHHLLDKIRGYAPQLASLRHAFDAASLPEPGFVGAPFSPFDAAALYAMVAEKRPKVFVEVGSGAAAAFAKRASEDHRLETRIIVIDPEPHAGIEAICDELVRRGLETYDLAVLDELEDGDLLFVESSHRTFMNSDVTVFMIDVLPRLKPGVVVGIHEIHLPWDYPDRLNDRYWSEAYLLAAYLIGARDRVEPILPTAWITRGAQFAEWFSSPLVDLRDANNSWRTGASLWFTHKS